MSTIKYRDFLMMIKLMKITNSIELLDWFKPSIDADSDYMVAKLTGLSTQNVSSVRTGKSEFSELTALKLLLVGEHPNPWKLWPYCKPIKQKVAVTKKPQNMAEKCCVGCDLPRQIAG